jgi:hypothetical protein
MFKKILRLNRYLWFANGLLIFGTACVLCLTLAYNFVERLHLFSPSYEPSGIIVDSQTTENAKKDSLQLQGFSYGELTAIGDSPYYYLKLHIKSYKKAKKYEAKADSYIYFDFGGNNDYYGDESIANIIFLDTAYQPIKILLNKKADISILKEPNYGQDTERIDVLRKHIIYKIAYQDTDKNGLLNNDDDHDVYISDINGANLRQVTNNITVSDVEIVDNASKLLITYREKNEIPKEHQYKQFMIYDIAKQKLSPLTALHKAILEAEKISARP